MVCRRHTRAPDSPAHVIDPANVRMIQRRDRASLLLEAIAVLALQALDGDNTIQSGVACFPHFTHTAFTDQGEDFVRSESDARCKNHFSILPASRRPPLLGRSPGLLSRGPGSPGIAGRPERHHKRNPVPGTESPGRDCEEHQFRRAPALCGFPRPTILYRENWGWDFLKDV